MYLASLSMYVGDNFQFLRRGEAVEVLGWFQSGSEVIIPSVTPDSSPTPSPTCSKPVPTQTAIANIAGQLLIRDRREQGGSRFCLCSHPYPQVFDGCGNKILRPPFEIDYHSIYVYATTRYHLSRYTIRQRQHGSLKRIVP